MATFAPSLAKVSAIARPIPLVPPVTRTFALPVIPDPCPAPSLFDASEIAHSGPGQVTIAVRHPHRDQILPTHDVGRIDAVEIGGVDHAPSPCPRRPAAMASRRGNSKVSGPNTPLRPGYPRRDRTHSRRQRTRCSRRRERGSDASDRDRRRSGSDSSAAHAMPGCEELKRPFIAAGQTMRSHPRSARIRPASGNDAS